MPVAAEAVVVVVFDKSLAYRACRYLTAELRLFFKDVNVSALSQQRFGGRHAAKAAANNGNA